MAPSPESTLRRRRRSGSSSDEDAPAKSEGRADTPKKPITLPSDIPTTIRTGPTPLQWIFILLHLVACGIYIAGLVLQKSLHTSVECEMTYSQRQLIPIPLSQPHPKYRLHKFVDQRDPRPHHKAMLNEWNSVRSKTGDEETIATEEYLQTNTLQSYPKHHCAPSSNDTTTTVLYIPGHWGSYMQSRSIGAHGIQLTGARDYQQTKLVTKALAEGDWKGQSLHQFAFDVYAMNFQEEGAALHAQLLWSQTSFVASVLQELVETCELSQVLLLGHSMGGYVARLVPALYPELRPFLPNIITLGSPHAHPVFGWESTVHQLHQTYLMDASLEENAVISISGGLRDEMIPPVACQAPNNHSLSVLSTEIMKPGPKNAEPQLGMDHRAIVWCHNLLSVVREVIYTLARQENQNLSPFDRLQAVRASLNLPDDHYNQALEEHQDRFLQLYGFASTIATEAAMLYHSELLVGLFVVLGCFHCIGTSFLGLFEFAILPIVTTICLASQTNYQIQLPGIVILTLVANAIFWIVCWIGSVALPYAVIKMTTALLPYRLRRIRFLTAGIFFLALGAQCVGKLFSWQARLCLAFLLAVYIGAIATAVAIAVHDPTSTRLMPFAATFFLLCPFLVTGKIVALFSGPPESNQPAEYLPDWGLLVLAGKLLLPVALRTVFHHYIVSRRGDTEETTRAVVLTLVVLYLGPSLFQMGQGYRAGDLLAAVSWLECLFLPLL